MKSIPQRKKPDVDQKKPGRNGGRGKKSGSANPATSTGGKQRSVLNMLMACYLSSGVLGATRDRSSWAWRPSAVPDSEFLTQPQLWVNDAPAGAVNTVLETEIVDNFLMVPIRTTIENGLQKGGIAALISDLEATADDLPPAFSIVINDLAGAGTSRLSPPSSLLRRDRRHCACCTLSYFWGRPELAMLWVARRLHSDCRHHDRRRCQRNGGGPLQYSVRFLASDHSRQLQETRSLQLLGDWRCVDVSIKPSLWCVQQ